MSFDMNKLMQQAAQMQEQVQKMQEDAANETAESSVGGGMVKVTANGAGEVLSITISPDAIDPSDPEGARRPRARRRQRGAALRVRRGRGEGAGDAGRDGPRRPRAFPASAANGLVRSGRLRSEVLSPAVDNLVAQLTRLPGIGSRTAQRLAFHILQVSKQEAKALAEAIHVVKERVRFCRECGNLTEEERVLDLPRRAARPRRSSASSSSRSTSSRSSGQRSTAASTTCSAARSRRSTASSRSTCASTSC